MISPVVESKLSFKSSIVFPSGTNKKDNAVQKFTYISTAGVWIAKYLYRELLTVAYT